MPKRSASDALQAVMPAPKVVEGSLKSRSGRVVRPKVWDDGTLAAPLAALKEDVGERSPGAERGLAAADAADPDFSLQNEEAVSEEGRASGGDGARGTHSVGSHRGGGGGAQEGDSGGEHAYGAAEPAYSDDSPRASTGGGSQGSMGRARSGSVGRDEHGKFTSGPRPRGSRGGRGGRGEGGGGIFKMAAVEVLRGEKRLMSTGEIARVALKRGLIKCTGKTPEATMASALYTDIKRKEGQSIFIRPHEGLFGLREWIEQGVAFQDEFAEEMAKRARAAFGMFAGLPGMPPMLPPMMDSDGVPIGTPYPPMVPYPGMPPMSHMGLPLSMLPGMAAQQAAVVAAAAAAAAAAAKGGADDSPDGLMELLSAAEELHKTSSKDGDEADVKFDAEGNPLPAESEEAAATTAEQCAGAAAAAAADGSEPMAVDGEQAQQAQRQEGSAAAVADAPAGSQGRAAEEHDGEEERAPGEPQPAGSGSKAVVTAGDEEDDAAAMLAAVAEAAAEEPTSRGYGGGAGPHHHAAGFPGFPHSHSHAEAAAAAAAASGMPHYHHMQYPYHAMYPPPYGYYPPHYMYGQPPPSAAAGPGLPPLPKQRGARGSGAFDDVAAAGELPTAGSSGSLDLVVLGSNRPFLVAAAAAAAGGGGRTANVAATMQAEGQEQVNILNLPLPEVEPQANAAAHGGEGAGAGPSAMAPEQLKEAEAQVMSLEKELGTSHPEVGKAYLSLSRLYLAGCAESASKQLAVAALGRAAEIMNVCQVSLKRQPSCTTSFSYLMDRIRCGEQRPAVTAAAAGAALAAAQPAAPVPAEARPLGESVAHGDAAHVALPAGSPMQAH